MVSHRRTISALVGICSALCAAWLAVTPERARASCAAPEPLPTLQAGADVIVLGQVTQTTGQDARFVVDTYRKGRGPRELNITGRYSSDPRESTSVDFIFKPGQRYLLFLTGSPPGLLRTNDCAGNREGVTALTPEEVAVLGQGVPPDPAIANPTPMPANEVGTRPSTSAGAAASDEQARPAPALNGRVAAVLLPIGILLVGLLVFIVMRMRRRVH